ncbi:beta transducin [Fusarium albosuccineum]|uniref:Beta transducin n=1 Tax=Fusarium albosuccineum TaxID=1237068 RepID=A0A8H4PBE9_9HYPO|nr:beta transducin [Fusarium albosuccineum]
MPLLYGEGKNAFMRLQEEIMKHSDDQSLLSWNFRDDDPSEAGVLASSPAAFSRCRDIIPCDVGMLTPPFSITNKGLRIEVPLSNGNDLYALLQCRPKRDPTTMLAVPLKRKRDNLYLRSKAESRVVKYHLWSEWKYSSVYLIPNLAFANSIEEAPVYTVYLRGIPTGYDIEEVYLPTYHRGIDPRVVMKGNLSGIDKDGVLVLLNSKEDEAEILILQIRVWEQESYLSGDSRQEFNLDISCSLMGSLNNLNLSLASLWQHRKDFSYRFEHLYTPEGHFDIKSSRESYFGKTLFCIDVRQGEELTWANALNLLGADWNGHPGLAALREAWLRSLKDGVVFIRTKLYAILRFIGLSPWMFTFFVECLIGRVFVNIKTGMKHVGKNWDRYATTSVLLYACRYALGPQRVSQVLSKIVGTPSMSRILHTLRNSTVDILALYLCCKMLPSQFLTAVSKTNGSFGAR